MSDPDSPKPLALCLKDVPAGSAGRALGLLAGDMLLAINGRAFAGTIAHLAIRFAERSGKRLALTFQRGPDRFTVLADRADLGAWVGIVAPDMPDDFGRIDPDRLTNWEILRGSDGVFDVIHLAPSALATILPPVWLLQMRLWVPFATCITAMAVAAAVSPLTLPVVWLAAGMHLRKAGVAYLRADRRMRGLVFHSVHAARNERAAQAAHCVLMPNDRSLFAPVPKRDLQEA